MPVSGNSRVIGIVGNPVAHSKSPYIHNTLAELLKKDLIYVPFNVEKETLQDAVYGLRGLNVLGVNVTIPYKEAVLTFLDKVMPEAKQIEAVNTIFNSNYKLVGYNTDYLGFIDSLKQINISFIGKACCVIGTGGAARAVLFALGKMGVSKIHVISRDAQKAELLTQKIGILFPDVQWSHSIGTSEILPCNFSLVVNTTPLGMNEPDPLPLDDLRIINRNSLVYDLIYSPEVTPLLRAASELGAKTMNGWPMLVFQAVRSFEIWTGIPRILQDYPQIIHTLMSLQDSYYFRSLPTDFCLQHPTDPPVFLDLLANGNLYLVGFMGAGKSTIGRQLAEHFNVDFIDTDSLIEHRHQMTISHIFAQYGEHHFRELEIDCILRNLPTKGAVIALGGGAFCDEQVRKHVNATGISLWIDTPFEQIWERVAASTNRPLLRDKQGLFDLYETRLPFYNQATLHIQNNGECPMDINDVLRVLNAQYPFHLGATGK